MILQDKLDPSNVRDGKIRHTVAAFNNFLDNSVKYYSKTLIAEIDLNTGIVVYEVNLLSFDMKASQQRTSDAAFAVRLYNEDLLRIADLSNMEE